MLSFVIVLSVCVRRAYHANWLACLCPHTLLKENARKTAFFSFRIKELNQIADINFSGIHGHAYKRAFEFHVLAYLAELINENVSTFVKCPNVSQPMP